MCLPCNSEIVWFQLHLRFLRTCLLDTQIRTLLGILFFQFCEVEKWQ
jgi:hypothetical protein